MAVSYVMNKSPAQIPSNLREFDAWLWKQGYSRTIVGSPLGVPSDRPFIAIWESAQEEGGMHVAAFHRASVSTRGLNYNGKRPLAYEYYTKSGVANGA